MSEEGAFRVDPGELVAHGGQVAQAATRLARAADSGRAVRLGAGSFGSICSFLPTLFDSCQGSVVQALRETAATVDSVVDALRESADRYVAVDTSVQDSVTAVTKAFQDHPVVDSRRTVL
jgi:hypothetical protein